MGRYDSEIDPQEHIEEFKKMSKKQQNEIIENPGHVDEGIWKKAKEAAKKSHPDNPWALTMYLYGKMGGK